MTKTRIEWCDRTWSPVTGCTRVSWGCEHCYARRIANGRLRGRCGYPKDDPFRVTLHPDKLVQPLHWRKPCRVFICSMSDLFHEAIPDIQIDQVIAVAAMCQQHAFVLLTKRPQRMREYLSSTDRAFVIQRVMDGLAVDAASGDEEWRPVASYEGLYEISSHGRVRRSGDTTKGRRNQDGILRPRVGRGGYEAVCLSRGGHVRQARVHRLVLEAFSGPAPLHDSEARHINGKRSDNRTGNLCWGTKTDNMADAARHGTAGVWAKSQAIFTAEQVKAIREARTAGAKLSELAGQYETSKQHISAICLGKKFKPAALQWPLPNVELGVSVEDQDTAEERIPLLLETAAAVRVVSIEPMLGPVKLHHHWFGYTKTTGNFRTFNGKRQIEMRFNKTASCLDWVILGGETGPGARPMQLDWARKVRDDCAAVGVPFFYKRGSDGSRLLDGRTHSDSPSAPNDPQSIARRSEESNA